MEIAFFSKFVCAVLLSLIVVGVRLIQSIKHFVIHSGIRPQTMALKE